MIEHYDSILLQSIHNLVIYLNPQIYFNMRSNVRNKDISSILMKFFYLCDPNNEIAFATQL